ncbi:hypothetical protein AB0K00_50290 [Dactylosporangium sp. NPDC049525]|uniref:hypothetical protein n=1 Tax=Dactylosporangium sp. NPDC049525 TaxID=3154730 RepID=UPI003431F696
MTQRPERRPARAPHTESLHELADICHDAPHSDPIMRIAVWRLGGSDDDHHDADSNVTFTSRLARQLVLIYSNRGDTILDLDTDPHLRAAARAAGRGYLAFTDTADIATLDDLRPADQPIGLVTMRWPRTSHSGITSPAAALADLFLACRLMTGGRATVIVAIRPATATDTDALADHEQSLRTAATAADFVHTQQIIAISAPGHADAFVYYANPTEAADTAANQSASSINLVAFTPMPASTRSRPRRAVHTARTGSVDSCDAPASGSAGNVSSG